jgi:hypothetical protein
VADATAYKVFKVESGVVGTTPLTTVTTTRTRRRPPTLEAMVRSRTSQPPLPWRPWGSRRTSRPWAAT